MKLDYQGIIEGFFNIRTKDGTLVPMRLNDVQKMYLQTLDREYQSDAGWRENILKARREGFSSLIEAIFTVDFIVSKGCGGQIISHKEQEVKPHIDRINLFLDSWLEKKKLTRSEFLVEDKAGYIKSAIGSELFVGTAGAKTLGRGGTLQNMHWTEVAFYPNTEILNAENLVPPAEEQVQMGVGKIFRESTGNMVGDFFEMECSRAQKGESPFKFRFFPWFSDSTNRVSLLPGEFEPTNEERQMMTDFNVEVDQVAWYREKAKGYKSRAKFLREYPSRAEEAFLAAGSGFFDADALKYYNDRVKDPIKFGELAPDGGWM